MKLFSLLKMSITNVFKSVVVSVSAFALMLATAPMTSAKSFPDVSSSYLYATAVNYITDQGIAQGVDNGARFAPDQSLSRAELTKMLMSAKIPASSISTCIQTYNSRDYWYVAYTDVPTSEWFAPHVCVANNLGIVNGYPDKTYKPHRKINFAEATKIITKSYGIHTGIQVGDDWYSPGIHALDKVNAIPPTISGPFDEISRGELAEIIYRLEKGITNKSSLTYDDLFDDSPKFTERILPATAPCNNCIVIPKLDIKVPIVFGSAEQALRSGDFDRFEKEILTALEKGVVHYPTTAMPGEGTGNVFLTGHSSYYADLPGSYKFIFQRLNELSVGDEFYIYSSGRGYGYRVRSSYITSPDDTSVVRQHAGAEIATLMTCWPVYTSKERKIIVADRVQ